MIVAVVVLGLMSWILMALFTARANRHSVSRTRLTLRSSIESSAFDMPNVGGIPLKGPSAQRIG